MNMPSAQMPLIQARNDARLGLAGRRVLLLGLGESNLAAARWCSRHGASLTVCDSRSAPPGKAELQAESPETAFHQDFKVQHLLQADTVVVGPGLSVHRGPAAEICAEANARGLPLWGEIELFAQALACHNAHAPVASKVVAITGTNGKTTTTRLVEALIERAGLTARACGNISPSALDALMAVLDDGAPMPDVWVLELSSFQLETVNNLAPDVATVLNVTQDHLDWHPTMAQYAQAKARIFDHAKVSVLNADDPTVAEMQAQGQVVRFTVSEPTRAGDFGLVDDGVAWLAYAKPVATDLPPKRLRKNEAAPPQPFTVSCLMPADALRIRGRHNTANALAALAMVQALDLPMAPLLHGLREFVGEPHRCQLIATIDGVDYIEDSKGTNVGATVAALTGLGQRVVLIVGGDGKGQDFSPLLDPVTRFARAVLTIGRDAALIESALTQSGIPIERLETLPAAVERAAMCAQPGDAVLLSPACASLDQFKNYVHRAEVFNSAVQALALVRGQI